MRAFTFTGFLLSTATVALVSLQSFAAPASDRNLEKKLMEEARLAFENGKYERALELYTKIPQNSDFWIDAMEERAWAHLQMNDNSKALALATTLTSEFLAPQVGPEPYFLRTLIDYRLCNIPGIFQDFKLFKKRFKHRSEEIEKLKTTSSNIASGKILQTLLSKGNSRSQFKADDFGTNIQFMPRYFYRDRTILASLESRNETRLNQRLSQLAEEDSTEIKNTLQKMQLLESQVVQQVFAYNKQMQAKRKVDFNKNDKNTLVFPVSADENENWVDEIDKLEAATADCPVDPIKGVSQ
jgi:tetratricopeptide (TPR) repeat protein